MKVAAGGKKVVRHDGHELEGGGLRKPHYQLKLGDGTHVFYNASKFLTPMLGQN